MDLNPIGSVNYPQVKLSYEKSEPARLYTSEDFEAKDNVDIRKSREDRKKRPRDTNASTSESIEPPPRNATRITIIHTNDLHGYIKNMPEVSGLINELRQKNPDAIVVDGGDVAYNPPVSDKHHFEPMVEIMNHIDYDIQSLGNHEFQWGAPTLDKELVSRLDTDVLGANVRDKKTGDYLPGVSPYVIKEVNGVKIGFIGVVTPNMATSAHPNVGKDVQKLDVDDVVKKLIPEVKAKGADVIVVMSHQGIDDDPKLARNVEGINVILSSHDHQLTKDPIVISKFPTKTYIVEAGSHAKYVGETTIDIDREKKEVLAVQMRAIPTTTNTVKSDPEVEKIVNQFMGYHSLSSIPEYLREIPDLSAFLDEVPAK